MQARRAWSKRASTTCGSLNSKASFLATVARVYKGPRCYPPTMTRHHYLVPLLLTVALVGCKSDGAPEPRVGSLDQEIQLAPREQAAFGQQGLTVEFVRVVEDSRCPSDATCVWAGEVKVQLSTRIDAAEAIQHEITAGQPATAGEFQLAVLQVQPERISTREISPEEYRVTVKVERTSE